MKRVVTSSGEFGAKAVILAVGGSPRHLGIPSEEALQGEGISYCATCDGDFFTDQEIVVVGGGNSALEEAVSLTRYASKVTLVHQFDHFQGYPHAVKAVMDNPKITCVMESSVEEFKGDDYGLAEVVIRSRKDDRLTTIPATGAFIFIGYEPGTDLFKDCVTLSDRREIITTPELLTSVPGVFAAGDARQKKYRQITTAVSDGTIAALSVMEYLHGVDPDIK